MYFIIVPRESTYKKTKKQYTIIYVKDNNFRFHRQQLFNPQGEMVV